MTLSARPRSSWLAPALLLLLFLLPFLVPLPHDWERLAWVEAAGDLAHVPLLGGLAWILALRGPLAGRPRRAAAAALLVGAAIEVIQGWVGRQLSLGDLSLDAVGIGLAVAVLRWRERRDWRWAALVVPCLLVLGGRAAVVGNVWLAERDAAARFPGLADLESRSAGVFWRSSFDGAVRLVPRDGGGRCLQLGAGPPGRYPGASLTGFPRDWSGYRRVEWDARVVGADSLRYLLRLDDFRTRRDHVWLAGRFTAGPQWRHFVWEPTDCLGRPPVRPVDRRDVDGLTFYVFHPAGPVGLQIDDLRLTR